MKFETYAETKTGEKLTLSANPIFGAHEANPGSRTNVVSANTNPWTLNCAAAELGVEAKTLRCVYVEQIG